jgi:toxin CptA
MPLAMGSRFGISMLVLASYLFYLRRDGLLASPGSITHIRFDHDGKCMYRTREGTFLEAIVLGSSLSTPWLGVLNLKSGGRLLARHAVIFPDSADAETLRKLRVLLRWKHAGTSRR